MGQYKSSKVNSDREQWLKLWTGAPWSYSRVGGDIDYYISDPLLPVVGGLQANRTELLGADEDGLQPRWFPHMVTEADIEWQPPHYDPRKWNLAIETLYTGRETRAWDLEGRSRKLWNEAARRWKKEARGLEKPVTKEALLKADQQCARTALVMAESLHPGGEEDDSTIPLEAMTAAIAITDYVMGVWRSMDTRENLSRTSQMSGRQPSATSWSCSALMAPPAGTTS